MKLLKKGTSGNEVKDWQYFLIGLEYYTGKADGLFKSYTETATTDFQVNHTLKQNGMVDRETFIRAIEMGFGSFLINYPARPPFEPILDLQEKKELFGSFDYEPAPTDECPEKIKVHGDWVKENIINVDIPQLSSVTNGKYNTIRFHKKCAYQLKMFFKELEKKDLLKYILSYGGSYCARYIKGNRKHLSNHAWGTAFGINVPQNGVGREPADENEIGTVLPIVPVAIKWGFYWGGHFRRKEGNHFEVAKVITKK